VKVHFTRAKRKIQLQGEYDANRCEIKKHEKERQMRIAKMEE